MLQNLHPYLAVLILALLTACGTGIRDPRLHSVSRTVVAFEDTDGDGNRDNGEALLPDVLIIYDLNYHRSFGRITSITTDADGEPNIEGTYTHYFYLYVLPPCGYTPTFPGRIDATVGRGTIEVGFQPDDPQPGIADLWVHLWEDTNSNGVQDNGEAPLSNTIFYVEPVIPGVESFGSGSNNSTDTNDLRLTTDAEGYAGVGLGNSCGTLRLRESDVYRDTVSISPEALTREDEEGVLFIAYTVGMNVIEWGLTPIGE